MEGYAVLSKLIDVQLFGGMVPEEARVIGLIQCEWAVSLHDIRVEAATITSAFSSAESKSVGSMGKKYFVPYGLYASGWSYAASRRREFGDLAGAKIGVRELLMFEEGLLNGSSHGRTTVKGFVEPLMVVKVVKTERVKSRYDGLSDTLAVKLSEDALDRGVLDAKGVTLKLDRLKKALASTDYEKVQVYVSESGSRRFPEIARFKKGYADLSVVEDDLESGWEYVVVYEVKQSNPNGDPDMDNMPRRYAGTEIGIISPERQKRWIRDYLEDMGEMIFVTRRGKVQKAKDRLKEIEDLI